MEQNELSNRMKEYENVQRLYLTRRTPTLIRVDGKAFHSFTKGFQRPFDPIFIQSMWDTAAYLCANIQGCKIAYVQSDEITLLLTDYDETSTQAWFNKNIVKMISVSASMATMAFNRSFIKNVKDKIAQNCSKNIVSDGVFSTYEKRFHTAMFDSRVFGIPKEEVFNNFLSRQQDATRNAIQMLGQSQFSHKQLQFKGNNEIQEMLWQEKQINFNDLPVYQKRGVCIIKEYFEKDSATRSRWVVDKNIPIFTQDRNYIERFV